MDIKTGLANYKGMVVDEWTTDDTEQNIGTQIVKFVKLNSKDIHIPELRMVFYGEPHTGKDSISSTLLIFPDSNAVLLVALKMNDKDQMEAVAKIIIDKMHEEKWNEEK